MKYILLAVAVLALAITLATLTSRVAALDTEIRMQEEQIQAIVKILELHREELKKSRAIGVSR
jgi:cell division protein FtsL